ncbi:MAG: hypothetical protein AB8B99_19530, partial [Phormidesmis sp.]
SACIVRRIESNRKLPETWMSSVFDEPLSVLKQLTHPEKKVNLAISMALSTDIEYPFSHLHIQEESRFDVHKQRVYGICLTKKKARVLIKEFAVEEISEAKFKKDYTKNRYKELFRRDAPLGERKAMLATYAEWLHLCGHGSYPLLLPDEFKQLLPEDWDSKRGAMVEKYELSPTETLLQRYRA